MSGKFRFGVPTPAQLKQGLEHPPAAPEVVEPGRQQQQPERWINLDPLALGELE
jgi:hypothetical protein